MTMDILTVFSLTVAGFLVLVLPGYVWLSWLGPAGRDPVQQLADALALSLSIIALVAMVGFLVGIEFSPDLLIVLYALLGFLAAFSVGLTLRRRFYTLRVGLRARRQEPLEEAASRSTPATDAEEEGAKAQGAPWPRRLLLGAAAISILGFAVAWRFFQIRGLPLPAWVDSLHHVLIVRLFLEAGGVPQSFDPYMPVPFYYHYGFHASAALFAFFTRLSPAQAVLVFGQVLNAAAALAVYRLGMALWADWRKAGLAGLLVAFVSQMPAYYVTWGRYTLLTGLVIMPVAMALTLEILQKGGSRARIAGLALLTAGLLLSHYYASILLAIFLGVALVLVLLARSYRPPGVGLWNAWGSVMIGAGAGVLLAAPWLYRVWGFVQAYTRLNVVAPSENLDAVFFSNYLPYLRYLLGPSRNYLLLGLAVLGLLFAGWRLRSLPLTLWALVVALLGVPWLPYLHPFRPDHALIVLFLPVTLLVANGLIAAKDRLRDRGLGAVGNFLVAGLIGVLLIWGLRDTFRIVNPITVLADEADLEAIAWVEENTPPEARFFINVTPWQQDVYRGVDGGWWILPLTGRETLIPPVMYLQGEADYIRQTNEWAAQAARLQGCEGELGQLVRTAHLDYLYLKDGLGSLRAESLAGCPGVERVYAQAGITIFRVEAGELP